MNKDSKIFVAGHKGLVGSAILNNLKQKGYRNFVLRDKNELNLINQQAVADFFAKEKPEYVFLAAAKVGGIVANNFYRADFIYENLQVQNNVIYESHRNGVKKLLFLGSTCIYPKNAPQPMREDSLLTSSLEYTNEPYAISKIAGIKLCESFNVQYGTNYLSVMPTNLYGYNDNFNLETSHVLPALIRKVILAKMLEDGDTAGILKDLGLASIKDANAYLNSFGISAGKVEVWGTGKPMREFLWSEDMADACVFIMERIDFIDIINDIKDKGSKEILNTHINIGTGIDISIKELADIIKELVGFKGEIYFNSNKPDGTLKKLTDVTKLNNLGWKYKVELKDGLKRLIKYYLENSCVRK